MARPSIIGDSDLVEDQIQREAETHGNATSSPEKKKRKRLRQGRKSEERPRGIFQDNVNPKDLDHDDSMGIVVERDPLESSPPKKRKRNRHRDQSKLYEVPGVENLPAKRKTSYRVAQDLAIDAIQGDVNDAPVTAVQSNNTSSYPEASPFVSPPKALVPCASAVNTSLRSPSAQQARLDTILKSCSRKAVADAALSDMELNNDSDGSPSPPTGVKRSIVKSEHEGPAISFRDILRECDGKGGRISCPIEGCEKSYTRKDSLSGHLTKSHSDQMLRDNGDKTYSVVTQSKLTPEMERNLQSARKEMQKYTKWGVNNNEGTRDKLSEKAKGKEVAATKLKPLAQNAATDLSVSAKPIPPAKSQLPDHNAGVIERDSSASSVVVQSSLPPRSPKPIKPAVGNITATEIPYGSAMEDWEVSPGIVRTGVNNVNSRGRDVAYSAHHIRNNPTVAEFANTSFAIHTILGGRSFGFPLETFVRICYVVSGKLQVQVDGADFAIGKGGMWRVTTLGSCVVGNRSYEDAIIHITSIRTERGGLV
ncbi:hypothetical protein VE03_02986 [Pseudogymnoascus sp. 23342-1-I1]|nr:hypothetical protein VE03_02986 [Pseudogymnoascus sp. 23342-1-I1]